MLKARLRNYAWRMLSEPQAHVALQRKVARLAADWRDPHDQDTWATRDIVQNIEVAEDGEVGITIKPARPHCPCCLLDLDEFRQKL